MQLLDDVTVIEATQMIAGPVAGSQLGDLGADVVKVEPPGGEHTRGLDPEMDGISSYFASVNRNKRYVTLDLKDDRGRAAFEALAADADVFLENFSVGAMDRLGLGYGRLREVNPDLIYCSINGYREGSRYEDLPSFDGVVQALGGVMSITGEVDGPPVRAGVPVADLAAGMYAVQTVLASLHARDAEGRDGGGRHVEIPLLDATVSLLSVRAGYSFATGEPYPRGSTHSSIAPWTVFETADSHLSVSVSSERLWENFCRAVGRPDLVDDDRFETNAKRVENADELYAILRPLLRERTADEWFERMREHGAPGAPVYDTVEMWDDPYIEEAGLVADRGPVQLLEPPVVVDGNRPPIREAPGPAGGDTDDVLSGAGYSEEEIDALRRDGVV